MTQIPTKSTTAIDLISQRTLCCMLTKGWTSLYFCFRVCREELLEPVEAEGKSLIRAGQLLMYATTWLTALNTDGTHPNT